MSFIWPMMLLSLLLLPLLVITYVRLQHRRARIAAAFSASGWGAGAVPGAQRSRSELRRHIPAAFFLISAAVLLFSLARPQAVVALPRQEGTVVLAFDVSGSMAADDMEPTRMEAAKAAAIEFIERQPQSVLIGVVAFSDSGMAVQTPSQEKETILAAINRLQPQRGTSLGQGIYSALNTIALAQAGSQEGPLNYSLRTPEPTPTPTRVPEGFYTPAVIVLLSDGENNESPNPLVAAQAAADRGIRIYTVGIGSPEGAVLNIDGFSVHSQLNEPLLQEIAQISGGAYYHAGDEQDLREIYQNLEPQLVLKPEEMEITSLFAGAGILFLMAGAVLSMLWFSRLP